MHPHRRILSLPDHSPIPKVPLPPIPAVHHHDHHIITITTPFLAALILIISTYSFILRCRRNRLYRRNFHFPPPPSAANDSVSRDGSIDDRDEPVHHVWLIRTVGLDDEAIEAIGAEEYKPGRFSGVSDCSVCLGEVEDGERVRLLPNCGHLFHVECIDTWLRAHVNCPLCRALVVGPKDPAPDLVGAVVEEDGSDDGIEVTVTVGLEESSLPQGLDSGETVEVSGLGESIIEDAAVVTVEEPTCRSFSKYRIRRANTSKGYSDRKTRLEVMRSLSSSGRGLFFSRN